MSEEIGMLIASAQGALRDVPDVHDYRAKQILIDSARVQAACARALALEHLATAVDRLVDVIAPPEGETP